MGKLITADNCSLGWVSAVEHLLSSKDDCFNLIIEIEKPMMEDFKIRQLLDKFIESSKRIPIDEVANTIFPVSLYSQALGRRLLYENYETAWSSIKLFPQNRWGTYFYRMIHWEEDGTVLNQLENTIGKLKKTLSGKKYRSFYEVSIYRPKRDGHIPRGSPCLSHLSFKLENDKLHLTAVYRNHYYIQRAYGNLVGLGHLMEFIAKESGISVGRLTCISTHAELDGPKQVMTELVRSCKEMNPSKLTVISG